MRVFAAGLMCCVLMLSCARSGGKNTGKDAPLPVDGSSELFSGARPALQTALQPAAVLKAGEYPLWFQLGAQGPALLNSIDEARYSRALIPWPLAPHVRFILARDDDVFMAINTDGFLALSPWNESAGEGTALYRFSGGALWQPYTVGAFVFYGDTPAALLYRDDRFLDSGAPLPSPRAWAFSMEAAAPFARDIPTLDFFPAHEGWDIDALRLSADGFWYYRAVKKDRPENAIRFLRSRSLDAEGESIGLGTFHNSALPESPAAAPLALQALLAAMKTPETVMAVSPDFRAQRYFAASTGGAVSAVAYCRASPPAALAVDIRGKGLRRPAAGVAAVAAAPDAAGEEFLPFELPPLPENFVYTGIALSGQTIVAVWEEQEEYYTGAAGFMVLRIPAN